MKNISASMQSLRVVLPILASLCLLVLLASSACAAPNSSGTIKERRGTLYQSPEAALEEFKAAFRSGDPERLVAIFGQEGRDIIISGDAVADRAAMRRMARRLDQRAEIIPVTGHSHQDEQWYKVRFGIEGWNMRIPLVNAGDGWYFATHHAKDAAQQTRIAINELTTMHTLVELAAAQGKYFNGDYDGDGVKEYAQRIISTPGKRDGLYWASEPGSILSPLEKLVNEAREDGYSATGKEQQSFEGYFYKVLLKQGNKAKGGARDFMAGDNMTGGYAFFAYPREWNKSGSYSFVMDMTGRMYKKDLGFRTASIGEKFKEHNPDSTWILVDRSSYGDEVSIMPR